MTTVFVCGTSVGRCTQPGCTTTKQTTPCTFPLAGRKTGQTCGMAVCPEHRTDREGMPLCGAHQRFVDAARAKVTR